MDMICVESLEDWKPFGTITLYTVSANKTGQEQKPTKNRKEELRMETYETTFASFDLETLEGQMKLMNAQTGASVSFKTLEDGTVLEVTDILQYKEMVDTYGQTEQESVITTLFAKDGTSYAGVSDTISKAGQKMIEFKTKFNQPVLYVKIVKQRSGKGNEFLNLQLVPGLPNE